MTDGSGGRRLPEPPGGPRRVAAPPPTPAQRQRTGSFPAVIPAAENAQGAVADTLAKACELVLSAPKGSLRLKPRQKNPEDAGVYDLFLGESRVGEYRQKEKRILVPYDPVKGFGNGSLAAASIPASLKMMAQARKMVLFFEITQNSIEICAGDSIGHKMMMSRMA